MVNYSAEINGIHVDAAYSEKSVSELFLPLLKHLTVLQKEKGSRILVMLAAPPGAGKSTLCSFLENLSKEHDDISERALREMADYTINISADEEVLRGRLIDRKIKSGNEIDTATRFVDFSDMATCKKSCRNGPWQIDQHEILRHKTDYLEEILI